VWCGRKFLYATLMPTRRGRVRLLRRGGEKEEELITEWFSPLLDLLLLRRTRRGETENHRDPLESATVRAEISVRLLHWHNHVTRFTSWSFAVEARCTCLPTEPRA
jgi:hypothetical protein